MMKPCPDSETIRLYMEGSLSPEKGREVANHLASCELCREATEGLARLKDFSAVTSLQAEVSERFGRKKEDSRIIALFTPVRAAASLIIIAGIAAAIYMIMLGESESGIVSDQLETPLEKTLEKAPPPPELMEYRSQNKEEGNIDITEEIQEPVYDETRLAEESENDMASGEANQEQFNQKAVAEKVEIVDEVEDIPETESLVPESRVMADQPLRPAAEQGISMDKLDQDRLKNEVEPEENSRKKQQVKRSASGSKSSTRERTESVSQSAPVATGNNSSSEPVFSNVPVVAEEQVDSVAYLDSLIRHAPEPENFNAALDLATYYLRHQETEKAKKILLELDKKENPCREKARVMLKNLH